MVTPLSILSPSKQNTRAPPSDTPITSDDSLSEGALADIPPPLFKNGRGIENNNMAYNDENASPPRQKRGWMSYFTSPRGTSNDDVDDADRMEEPQQDPPSSPFQESVGSDRTASFARDTTPRAENDASSQMAQDVNTRDDVSMTEHEQQPSQPDPTELQDMDVGNDAIHEELQENVDDPVPNTDTPDCSVIHNENQQADRNTTRKVSNMTVENEGMSAVYHQQKNGTKESSVGNDNYNYDTGDDTCLSTFSAIPNADMTPFSKAQTDSPAKRLRETLSPKKLGRPSHLRESVHETPGSVTKYSIGNNDNDIPDLGPPVSATPAGSPTPRRKYPRIDDSFNLLEFTDQFKVPSQACRPDGEVNDSASPSRRATRRSPMRRSPVKANLLDFDIPPAPTPRSTPTITPRELESLKSSFMSQISSLKATMSGRDAEVASLKEAVADAERRAGEAWEEVRNESARKEFLEAEQREWERRGKEMESVLRGVKSDIVDGEREKERLTKKADDAEKAKENFEGRVVELESQLSAAREAATQPASSSVNSAPDSERKSSVDTAKEVQDAVEKVARELHSLYKSKHETKVAALKKSYEARWEKRVREVENKLRDAVEETERLKTERDATMSGEVPGAAAGDTTILRESEELEAQKRVLEAKVKGLEQELVTVKRDSETLRSELRSERAEKGELVAVVDEWLNMQQEQQEEQEQQPKEQEQELQTQTQTQPQHIPSMEPPTPRQPSPEDEDAGKRQEPESPSASGNENTGAPSGGMSSGIPGAPGQPPPTNIRPRVTPGMTPKVPRFGMPSGHSRGNSNGEKNISSGIGRIPAPGRSGIMSSIERMGRGGG